MAFVRLNPSGQGPPGVLNLARSGNSGPEVSPHCSTRHSSQLCTIGRACSQRSCAPPPLWESSSSATWKSCFCGTGFLSLGMIDPRAQFLKTGAPSEPSICVAAGASGRVRPHRSPLPTGRRHTKRHVTEAMSWSPCSLDTSLSRSRCGRAAEVKGNGHLECKTARFRKTLRRSRIREKVVETLSTD